MRLFFETFRIDLIAQRLNFERHMRRRLSELDTFSPNVSCRKTFFSQKHRRNICFESQQPKNAFRYETLQSASLFADMSDALSLN